MATGCSDPPARLVFFLALAIQPIDRAGPKREIITNMLLENICRKATFGRFEIRACASAIAVCLVAACSALPVAIPGLPQTQRPEPPPCPNVTIMDAASRVTKFLPGQGRDISDIVLVVGVSDFQGFCETRTIDERTQVVNVEITIVFRADKGPANRSGSGEFSYFVAVVDSAEQILAKEVFPVAVAFGTGRNRVFADDIAYQEIELLTGESAANYEVIIGLQLSNEELARNRELSGR